MGLLDKVKGILFDEEEVELPEIKKEPTKKIVEEVKEKVEENPITEIKVPKDDFSDKDNYKSESTFTFPIDFDDDIEPEPVRPIVKRPVYEETVSPRKSEPRNYSDYLKKTDEKKKFKPTPIISPVYGVLDQNYKKEDVIVKKDILRMPNELTLDEVRKRAFGSLEDELEQTLTSETEDSVIKIKEKVEAKRETVIEPKKEVVVEKPVDKKKTIGELIEEDDMEIELPVIESINESDNEYTNNDTELQEEPTNSIEDLLSDEEKTEEKVDIDDEIDEDEADLFSLIDSMYEEKGE